MLTEKQLEYLIPFLNKEGVRLFNRQRKQANLPEQDPEDAAHTILSVSKNINFYDRREFKLGYVSLTESFESQVKQQGLVEKIKCVKVLSEPLEHTYRARKVTIQALS